MRVYLFCRFPELGKVKSRLASHCGDSAALALYEKMLNTVLNNINESGRELLIHYTGCNELQASNWLEGSCMAPQVSGDLGEKLLHAVDAGFEENRSPIVLIGADCPEIDGSVLDAVEAALTEYDIVVGPAVDGGYYLLALKESNAELFTDIDWGTENVLDQTLYACKRENLSVALLEEKNDLDRWEDLPEEWRSGVLA